jgi:Undecaprenyl-phosphate galactose phosphotransferase WbaP
VKRLLYAMRIWGRPVVILGAGDTGRRVARALQRTPLDGLHPLAFFDDHVDTQQGRIEGLRVHGDLDEAAAFARRHHVQHAIVAISSLGARRLDRLVTGSGRVFRRVQFVPKLGALPSEDVVATGLDGMLALEVRNGLFSPVNRAVKRAADAAGAVTLGLAASPLLLALWAWVRLDSPGGGFHRSQRIGQDGRRFACLKFRTMHEDAESRLQEILATDPARRAEYERWHKLDDDPRVTRAGRFLRRTSLDELPQLWNVLKGEMSLVGPRPYLARELPDMGAYRDILLQAKPGMTGHWQVSARSSVTFAERLEIEAHYVRNWSVWWDIVLMVQTPMAVLRSEGEAK